MDIIVGGRQTGKTTAAVKIVKANGGILIVNNGRLKEWVSEQFGLDAKQIATTHDLMSRKLRGHRHSQNVGFDNVDLFLAELLGWPARFITLGGDVTLLHAGDEEQKNDEGLTPGGWAKSPI